jgi:hypothetical protein
LKIAESSSSGKSSTENDLATESEGGEVQILKAPGLKPNCNSMTLLLKSLLFKAHKKPVLSLKQSLFRQSD